MAFNSVDAAADIPFCNPSLGLPCPPTLKIIEGEVNQGLRDYQLVAGKDTLVRVFVADVPQLTETFPLRIDRAELDATNVTNGRFFTLTAAVINNPITNTSQQFSENNNVNFYVEGSRLSAGDYEFTARLYSNSITPIKEFPFPAVYSFSATKDLNILVVFGYDPTTCLDVNGMPKLDVNGMPKACLDVYGMDPDLRKNPIDWDYIQNHTLPTLSRIFPIRRGIGTIDTSADCTGDHTNGLRYFVSSDTVARAWDGGAVLDRENDALRRFNSMLVCEQADDVVVMFRNDGAVRDVVGIEGGVVSG
jgi:hypothetical protein